MDKLKQTLFRPAVARVVLLPLVGVAGTLAGMAWPAGHHAFCAGLAALGA